ncbi:MAG: HAD family hydrolase [Streptosporangiaceae bacterium]|nr:HAD family hydrolase [Streptosporangiaceae bacterium]
MTQILSDHADLIASLIGHRIRHHSRWRSYQPARPPDIDPADITPPGRNTVLAIQGIIVSHRHASQHKPAQKQAAARPLVRSTRKPEPLFYALVLATAGCPASQILFVGDNLENDVVAPIAGGMHAALVRPGGLRPGETLPEGALLIRHVSDLPTLLEMA